MASVSEFLEGQFMLGAEFLDSRMPCLRPNQQRQHIIGLSVFHKQSISQDIFKVA